MDRETGRILKDIARSISDIGRRLRIVETKSRASTPDYRINARKFSVAANGVIDDTSSFESAVVDAISKGRPLYLPKGDYYLSTLTAPIDIDGDLHIVGDGIGITNIIGQSGSVHLFSVTGSGIKVHIEGISFDTFDNVIDLNSLTGDLTEFIVDECEFKNADNGIAFNEVVDLNVEITELRITNCIFDSMTTDAIQLRNRETVSAWIVGNRITNCGYRGIWCGRGTHTEAALHGNFIIKDNYIADIGASDTRTEVHAIITMGHHIICENNIIDNIWSNSVTDNEGIYTKCRYGSVSRNLINDGAFYGIMAKGVARGEGTSSPETPESYAMIIEGNVVVHTATLNALGNTNGIAVTSGEDILVTGNHIEGQNYRGIVNSAAEHVKIDNNTIVHLSTTSYPYGITIGSGASAMSDVQITNNRLKDIESTNQTTCQAILISGGTYAISNILIKGNVIQDISSTSVTIAVDFQATVGTDLLIIEENVFDSLSYAFRMTAPASLTELRVINNTLIGMTTSAYVLSGVPSTYIMEPNNGWRHVGISLPANDTTPSVANRDGFYYTANSNPTTISMFDDGISGQVIHVIINDGNTTIDFSGTNLKGNNGGDWTPNSGDTMTCFFNGTNWYCRTNAT